MKRGIIFFIVLAFSIIFWINFNPNAKKFVFDTFKTTIYLPKLFFNIFHGYNNLILSQTELRNENEALRAKVFDYERRLSYSTSSSYKKFKYVDSEVYSRYPFNNKDYIMIDSGLDAHVTSSLPVLLYGSILVGQVDKVSSYSSRVKTVFDTSLKFSVRIAGGGRDSQALFVGGNTPRVIYIDKNLDIKKGDVVYSASSDFPLGIKVGEIDEFYLSNDNAFREASLKIPYSLSDLTRVMVIFNK